MGIETSGIDVRRGDQLANIPQHRLKMRLNYEATPDLRLGLHWFSIWQDIHDG